MSVASCEVICVPEAAMELLHTCEPLRALAVRERLGCAMFNGMSGDTLAEPGDEEGGVPGGTGRKAEAGDSAVAAHAHAILEAAQAAALPARPLERGVAGQHRVFFSPAVFLG